MFVTSATTDPAPRRARPARAGFTVVELLVVISIIVILTALLIPAVSNAIRKSRETATVADFRLFRSGFAQLQADFSPDSSPPSFIIIYEQGSATGADPSWGNDTTTGLSQQHQQRNIAIIRRMWPQFDFASMGDSMGSPMPVRTPGNPVSGNDSIDLNGDGDETDYFVLSGAECLVFFLAGPVYFENGMGTGTVGYSGFSANPRSPFSLGGSRRGPYATFDTGRFVDVDGDGFPEYVDAFPNQRKPILYLSSYDGRGYQPYGFDTMQGNADDELLPVSAGGMMFPYLVNATATPPTYWDPQGYQLISPGADGEYGTGGVYNGENVPSDRPKERDNLTNFKNGRLN